MKRVTYNVDGDRLADAIAAGAHSGRTRALESRVDRLAGNVDRLERERERREADDLIDGAIKSGALPSSSRESMRRLFQANPGDTQRLIMGLEPDAAVAARNAADDPELDAAYEAFADRFGLPKDSL